MDEQKPGPLDYFRAIFLNVPDKVDEVLLGGRALVYVGVTLWGLTFIFHSVESNYVAHSFLHNVNLAFHEAGHIVFRIFGHFMMVAGGTLAQILMPATVMAAFLFKNRDGFGASIGLWWVGQNFIDIAPYVNDARDLELILLGGVTGKDVANYHDWEYLLGVTGLLEYDHFLAKLSHFFGSGLMILAGVWGGYMLYRQYLVYKEQPRRKPML